MLQLSEGCCKLYYTAGAQKILRTYEGHYRTLQRAPHSDISNTKAPPNQQGIVMPLLKKGKKRSWFYIGKLNLRRRGGHASVEHGIKYGTSHGESKSVETLDESNQGQILTRLITRSFGDD